MKKGQLFILIFVLAGCACLVTPPAFPSTDSRLVIPSGSQACTSFCLDDGGYAVFGTNYDHWVKEGLLFVNKRDVAKTALERGTSGRYARWTSKFGSVTFNLVGYQYPWAGMNEAGLMISTMALDETQNPSPDDRPPLDSPLWMQYQLDNYGTVAEVLASDAIVRMANTVDHYLVCDRTRNCATIEFLDGEMVAHSGETLPVAALTNSVYEKSVRAWQEDTLSGNSLRRFGTAAERVQSFDPDGGTSTVDYAFDTLKQVGSIWTQWSIVFDAGNLRVYFRTKTNPQIRHFDFDMLDFACGTPVEMLDLHEDLSGDVSDDLVAYSHQASFDHTAHFFKRWDIDMSSGQVNAFLRRLENFSCVGGRAHINDDADSAPVTLTLPPNDVAPSEDMDAVGLEVIYTIVASGAVFVVYLVYRSSRQK